MFRTIEDFKKHWLAETDMTLGIFRSMTDESLGQKIDAEGGRTVGRLAWHLVQTLGELPGRVGLHVNAPSDEAPIPPSAAIIADQYEIAAKSLLEEVEKNWNNDTLLQQDDMYGQMWYRGETLFNLIAHQAHHRGQMTVLLRQAGLRFPGIYGPTREEWVTMGMPALI